MCICSLSEKLQIRDFAKNPILPGLFKKLLPGLIFNGEEILKPLNIGNENIKDLTKNINLPVKQPVKSNVPTKNQKMQIEKLVNTLLGLSDKKLTCSIAKIILFINPTCKNTVGQATIKSVLVKAISALNTQELNALDKIINSSAFATIVNHLDVLTDATLTAIQ
jgi:hypothetical protein